MSTIQDNSETIHIGCECHSPAHIVRVSYWDWQTKDRPEVYMQLQADRCLTFWQRLKLGTKFILGTDNLEWHDVSPTHDDLTKLQKLLRTYSADYKLWEKANSDGK